MDSIKQLIAQLSDGYFHSGSSLALSSSLSLARVRQLVRQLPRYGLQVVAQPGRGYRLTNSLELLNREMIEQGLSVQSQAMLADCLVLGEVTSTNDILFDRLDAQTCSKNKATVCLAEFQSKGRGRSGRTWVAPYGSQICLSVSWRFDCGANQLAGLSLAVAVVLRRALLRYGLPEQLQLKWPNDLLFANKKLAGILIESKQLAESSFGVVIGFGVNLTKPDDQQLARLVADLTSIMRAQPERNRIIALILDELLPALQLFEEQGLKAFYQSWQGCDAFVGKKVRLFNAQQEWQGVAEGVGAEGEFLLQLDSGEVKAFRSGDVSLRLCEDS